MVVGAVFHPIAYTDFDGKYKIHPQSQSNYPKLSNYLNNGIKEVLESPELKEAPRSRGRACSRGRAVRV